LRLQTWEDPNVVHQETKAKGDNDPLDVCEIGELVNKPGEVIQVKVLGVMALLDEGETDWKIMVINVNDPLAPKLNDVEDVERHLPGLLRATNEWFRIYKIPDGKPENQFAFSGECKNKKYAMDIVRECAEAWEKLVTGKTPKEDLSLYVYTLSFRGYRLTHPVSTPPCPTPPTAATPSPSTSPRARTSRLPPSTPASTSGSTSLARPPPRQSSGRCSDIHPVCCTGSPVRLVRRICIRRNGLQRRIYIDS
jgi:inorganic pyrophosphatase